MAFIAAHQYAEAAGAPYSNLTARTRDTKRYTCSQPTAAGDNGYRLSQAIIFASHSGEPPLIKQNDTLLLPSILENTYQVRLKNALRRAKCTPQDIEKIFEEEMTYIAVVGRVDNVLTRPEGTSSGKERFSITIFGWAVGAPGTRFGLDISMNEVEVIAEARRAQSHNLGFQIGFYGKPPNNYGVREVLKMITIWSSPDLEAAI